MELAINTIIHNISLIYIFGFIGGGLKYIDQVYDCGLYSRKTAWLLVIVVGMSMGLVMGYDSFSAEILLSIILGVAFTSKLDNHAFRTTALLAILVPAIVTYSQVNGTALDIRWLGIAILTFSAVSDEYLDSFKKLNKFKVFQYRPVLKISMLIAAYYGFYPIVYFFGLMAFDLSYIYVTWQSKQTYMDYNQLTRRSNNILID